MDRVTRYLDAVPLPLLIAGAIVAAAVFIFLPNRWRLPLALIVMPVWMTLGRLPGLGMVQAVAKPSGVVAYGFVLIAAILTPGSRRRLPGIVWLYPVMALIGLVYLPTLTDALFAAVLQFQLFVLMLAAIFTVRTVVDEASLMRVVTPLTIGISIALMIPLSALLLHPSEAFAAGLGRFQPYGANQNQIGVVFVLAMPLALYAAFRHRSPLLKAGFAGIAAVAVGLGLITASRSVLIVMAMVAFPLGFPLLRRPVLVAIVGVMGLVVVGYLISRPDEVAYNRLETLQTGRVEVAIEYLKLIAQRPLFGLMGTSGMSALSDDSIGLHPHNAYIEMLYLGGLSYFLPMMTVVLYSGWCAVRVYFARKRFAMDPVLVALLCAFLVGMYAHGFVNSAILYPTYTWSWWHVTLAMLMIGLAHDLRVAQAAERDAEMARQNTDEYGDDAGDEPVSWDEDHDYHAAS